MFKILLLLCGFSLTSFSVEILSVPDDGISPQAITDNSGTTHMIFYKGDPMKGNLFYCTKKKNETKFAQSENPIQVNSVNGTAVSMGTIRSGQIALGKDGIIHVVWNGSPEAKGQLLYSRKLPDKSFTAQINLMGNTSFLDGGASVAANDKGSVHVVWHANSQNEKGEASRRVFIASSNDNGENFQKEKAISATTIGICPCCSLKAFSNENNLHILFRGAQGENRDVYQLISKNDGNTFESVIVDKWKTKTCPMSSQSISLGKKNFLTAWENEGKIYFTTPNGKTVQVPNGTGRKHPVIIQNNKEELLVAWAEGTGWKKGGDLCWQKFSSEGEPLTQVEKIKNGIKVWSVFTAFSEDDKFFLVH